MSLRSEQLGDRYRRGSGQGGEQPIPSLSCRGDSQGEEVPGIPSSPAGEGCECAEAWGVKSGRTPLFQTLDELDKAVADRCLALVEQHEMIRATTLFHLWPNTPAVK